MTNDRPVRYGMTIPLAGERLADARPSVERLVELGYTDLWSAETDGYDAFTPLALASQWAPGARLGTAIVPIYTRGPALIAQSAAAMADIAPGRFVLGIGTSSEAIVAKWNAMPFDHQFARARDLLEFLRAAFAGEKIRHTWETFDIQGFRLSQAPVVPPEIYLAALRPGMLRLAAAHADGVITNWLGADDVAKVVEVIGPDVPLAARIFVCPTTDRDAARGLGRRLIAEYLNVRAYAEFHRWLGRGPALEAMWEAWAARDRTGALAAIPDEVVDALFVSGTTAECRREIERYRDNGITEPVLMVIPMGVDPAQALQELGPRAMLSA